MGKIAVILFCSTLFATNVSAQNCDAADVDRWIEARISFVLKKAVTAVTDQEKRSGPGLSGQTSSPITLADFANAPDLIGAEIQLSALSFHSDESEPNSITVTANPYLFKSLLSDREAFEPHFYNENRLLRRTSFSFSIEKTESNPSEFFFEAKQAIYPVYNENNENKQEIDKISMTLGNGKIATERMADQIKAHLYAVLGAKESYSEGIHSEYEFQTKNFSQPGFKSLCESFLSPNLQRIDQIIANNVRAIVEQDRTIKEMIRKVNSKPKISVAFQTTKIPNGDFSEYLFDTIFEKGLPADATLSLNATYHHERDVGVRRNGAEIALGVEVEAFQDFILPLTANVSANALWLTQSKPFYEGELSFSIEIKRGLQVPIALHLEKNLENDSEINYKVSIGFVFDISEMLLTE